VAYLNTRTELRWLGEEDGDRRAELIKGEALFQIEHDERRPFVVVMETSEIHVLGTKFSVYRKTDNLTLVTVFEGTVEIRVSSNGSGSPAWVGRLSANQQMEYGPDGPSTAPQPRIANVAVLDQWRFGQLVLPDEGLPLPVVVSELSRYTDKRIVLGDPRLEELRVGGKFPTQDLRQALTRISRFVPMTFREQDDSFVLEYRTDDEQ
jgi:transmembrane sensor